MVRSPMALPGFVVPPALEATLPAERRGLARDHVRLLTVAPAGLVHGRFSDLARMLEAGDLVVVNTSATLPAALRATRANGEATPVHVSTWLDPATWIVEIRRPDNAGPDLTAVGGDVLHLPTGLTATLLRPYPGTSTPSRLWMTAIHPATDVPPYLHLHGRPIAYGHLARDLPLSAHQTVYADQPGSAEMPSAGRPFTADLLVRVIAAGIVVAPLVLHAGVSSPEAHEAPAPERYVVPESTSRLVASTRRAGRRVVAVGTTVVRALETDADRGGAGSSGWADLVLGPDRPARVVNGLVTGLHLPESSHLLLLQAVAGAELVDAAYASAIDRRYLWHEFGDSMLFLP